MRKNLPPLVIYPSRVKTIVLVAISAVLLIIPILAFLFLRDRIDATKAVSYRLYPLIWIGIGLFLLMGSLGLAFNLRQLAFPKPVVTISGDGIELLWFGMIKWDEIDHVMKVLCQGQCLMGIYPKNNQEFVSRQPGLRRNLIGQAIDQGFPPLYVTQMALPMTVDELLAEIRRYTDVSILKQAR